MNINIRTRGFRLGEALNEYVKSKLYLVLGRYGGQIQSIDVTLLEVNGSKGCEYVKCLMSIKLSNRFDPIIVHDALTNADDVVSACSQRAKRTVERHFDRMQRMNRKPYYRCA